MKNPRLTLKLNLMMREEIQERKDLISCLISYYSKRNPKLDIFELIASYSELTNNELSQLLGDVIDNKYNELLFNFNLN